MPDYFTHYLAAAEIFRRLDKNSKDTLSRDGDLYLLGAQGPDVFFFYGLSVKHNPGRMLHRAVAAQLFSALMRGNAAYCAGWATHYALDCTVHPAVYAYEHSHRGMLLHQKFEADLGLYVSRQLKKERMIMPKKRMTACAPAVCDSVRNVLPFITAAGTSACLKRHYLYTRRIYAGLSEKYKLKADYAPAYEAFERGVELGIATVRCVLQNNIDPEIFSRSFLEK